MWVSKVAIKRLRVWNIAVRSPLWNAFSSPSGGSFNIEPTRLTIAAVTGGSEISGYGYINCWGFEGLGEGSRRGMIEFRISNAIR